MTETSKGSHPLPVNFYATVWLQLTRLFVCSWRRVAKYVALGTSLFVIGNRFSAELI